MADLVYKAHRDEGGWGIAPPDPSFLVINGDEEVTLQWEVDEKTSVNGQTICHSKGVMIRRSTEKTPETELEGELVINSAELKGSYTDTGLSNGTTYYYKAFPYSDHYVYNRGASNIWQATPSHTAKVIIIYKALEAVGGSIEAKKGSLTHTATVNSQGMASFELEEVGTWRVGGQKVTVSNLGEMITLNEMLFGYDWTLAEANTESNITYPAGVDNAEYEGVPVRGADASIDIGDWQQFHDWLGIRPVMLGFDGEVLQELNAKNQTLTATGASSSVADQSVNANAMVEFPKRYFKRWTDEEGVAHFRVSRLKLGADWKCYPWMYGDTEATAFENDAIYLPMFEGSSISSKVRSVSGKTPMNTQTGATEWTQIQALGSGWIFDDYCDAAMIIDYMFMMGKSTDVQAHWGNGHYTGGSQASHLHKTGSLVTYGPYYGGNGNTNMKFMWLENWIGDRWERTFGVWFINSILYVKDFAPYTVNGDVTNYKNLGRGIGGTSGGYISEVTYDEHGMIPKTAAGAQNKYVPDGCWFANGTNFLIRSASCDYSFRVGAAFGVASPFSDSNWGIGPSPAYKNTQAGA